MKLEKTNHQGSMDAKMESVDCNVKSHFDPTLEAAVHSAIDNGKAICTRHPLADLLGTFTGATWEEIRREMALERQNPSLVNDEDVV